MIDNSARPNVGDTAKVWSGIRDVDIKVGESSPGQKYPLGPYSKAEMIAIAVIMGPTITWARTHLDSGFALQAVGIGVAITVLVVVALRIGMPKRRPSLGTRLRFFYRSIRPLHVVTSTAPTRRSTKRN